MSSRKRKVEEDSDNGGGGGENGGVHGEDDHEDDDDDDDDDKASLSTSPPPPTSPPPTATTTSLSPEMRLRSGRKKKRKRSSPDGAAAADVATAPTPNSKPPASKRPKRTTSATSSHSINNSDGAEKTNGDKKEEMSTTQGVAEEEDGKVAPSNGVHHASSGTSAIRNNNNNNMVTAAMPPPPQETAATATVLPAPPVVAAAAPAVAASLMTSTVTKGRVPAVDILKLPSQHTPGKQINETARLSRVGRRAEDDYDQEEDDDNAAEKRNSVMPQASTSRLFLNPPTTTRAADNDNTENGRTTTTTTTNPPPQIQRLVAQPQPQQPPPPLFGQEQENGPPRRRLGGDDDDDGEEQQRQQHQQIPETISQQLLERSLQLWDTCRDSVQQWIEKQARDDDANNNNNRNDNDDDDVVEDFQGLHINDNTNNGSTPWQDKLAPKLQKTSVWVVLFLVLLSVLQLWINPVMSSAVSVARVAVPFYKGILPVGARQEVVVVVEKEEEEPQEEEKEAPPPPPDPLALEAVDEIAKLSDRSRTLQQQLMAARDRLFRDLAALEDESTKLFPDESQTAALQASEQAAMQRIQVLKQSIQQVQTILDQQQDDETTIFSSPAVLQDIRTALAATNGAEPFLMDLTALQMQNLVPIVQDHRNPETDDATATTVATSTAGEEEEECDILERSDVARALQALKKEINQHTDAIQADEELVDTVIAWVLQHADQELKQLQAQAAERQQQQEQAAQAAEKTALAKRHEKKQRQLQKRLARRQRRLASSTVDSIRSMIATRLEVESADRTGKMDHAALYSGARVITTGPHATSPSLVDNLPFLNRLASTVGLRFYGYGPEAALTPTFPAGSLGQCWSFERDDTRSFAKLSIRLARPILVTSVSIEHVPAEITDKVESAIRKFFVLGFEDAHAMGDAWEIGGSADDALTYDIGSPEIIQEFKTVDEVNGDTVPPLQSITVVIESTWGLPYACLYRLRVHGDAADNAAAAGY